MTSTVIMRTIAARFVPIINTSSTTRPYINHNTAPAEIKIIKYFEMSFKLFVLYPLIICSTHPERIKIPASTPKTVKTFSSISTAVQPSSKKIHQVQFVLVFLTWCQNLNPLKM